MADDLGRTGGKRKGQSEKRAGGGGRKPRKQGRSAPRKATPERLEKAALHYLARFAASEAQVRTVLDRRVKRSAKEHGTDPGDGALAIEAIIEKLKRLGYLDDAKLSETRAEGLFQRGTPLTGIRFKLKQQGFAEDVIEAALAPLEDAHEDPNLRAALTHARRRKLGPFAASPLTPEVRQKHLARLARAGFDFETARRVLEMDADEVPKEPE